MDSIDTPGSVVESVLGSQKHDGLGFKMCELSEKSLGVCMELTDSFLLLVLLFSLPLFPLISRVVKNILEPSYLAKPRRIHLCFCRFQE
ncbi:hypothetical protein [Shewanella sp.]|uniref:hypothetical protein n=1 Tax=Shewanella sp. TaxID=50422 RepID=UPI001EB14735|nr:hypothetical protein [Shewanella sp.]NRB25924.1 hypothetical protein [Shewanella sp.]